MRSFVRSCVSFSAALLFSLSGVSAGGDDAPYKIEGVPSPNVLVGGFTSCNGLVAGNRYTANGIAYTGMTIAGSTGGAYANVPYNGCYVSFIEPTSHARTESLAQGSFLSGNYGLGLSISDMGTIDTAGTYTTAYNSVTLQFMRYRQDGQALENFNEWNFNANAGGCTCLAGEQDGTNDCGKTKQTTALNGWVAAYTCRYVSAMSASYYIMTGVIPPNDQFEYQYAVITFANPASNFYVTLSQTPIVALKN